MQNLERKFHNYIIQLDKTSIFIYLYITKSNINLFF